MSGTVSASPRAPRYRNAKGQFCKACDAVPVVAVSAPASPVLPPVIDDAPVVSAPVRMFDVRCVECGKLISREGSGTPGALLSCAECLGDDEPEPVRSAPVRHDRSGFLALALFVLAVLATAVFVVMPGPQASASVERAPAVHGAGHAAFRFSEARTMHLATCDRLSGKGDDGWYVEAARLTAESGSRYTARSLATSCALASIVRPVVR